MQLHLFSLQKVHISTHIEHYCTFRVHLGNLFPNKQWIGTYLHCIDIRLYCFYGQPQLNESLVASPWSCCITLHFRCCSTQITDWGASRRRTNRTRRRGSVTDSGTRSSPTRWSTVWASSWTGGRPTPRVPTSSPTRPTPTTPFTSGDTPVRQIILSQCPVHRPSVPGIHSTAQTSWAPYLFECLLFSALVCH